MAKIDHHLHTTRYSPDSIITPRELMDRALTAGLDGVVITEHDRQWEEAELLELGRSAPGLAVLSGVEVTTREGDFLVYGLRNADETFPGIDLKDLMRVVRREGAALVAAHPFRWQHRFDLLVEEFGPVFDGLELVSNNITLAERRLTEDLLIRYPMGVTGSSDAHEPPIVGCYYTEFPGSIAVMADFVAAIRSGLGKPRHWSGAPRLACGTLPTD